MKERLENQMNSTVLSILQILFNAAVIGVVTVPVVGIWIKTKGKFVEFMTTLVQNVASAELSGADGAEKRAAVETAVAVWCENNGVGLNVRTIERLIDLTVATANLVKRFIKKQ